jgi:hypothetical protein
MAELTPAQQKCREDQARWDACQHPNLRPQAGNGFPLVKGDHECPDCGWQCWIPPEDHPLHPKNKPSSQDEQDGSLVEESVIDSIRDWIEANEPETKADGYEIIPYTSNIYIVLAMQQGRRPRYKGWFAVTPKPLTMLPYILLEERNGKYLHRAVMDSQPEQ